MRILAVDDDRSYLGYVKLVLTRAGFEVEVACDGPTAIELLRTRETDLLLVDLTMPGMDGIQTVQQIQTEGNWPRLYTILLTAKDGTDTKLRALDSGFDDFLTKMSSEVEIVAKIRSAARRVEMERRLHAQNEELQALALTDELTKIANRRAFLREGENLIASARKFSVVLFDLDRFKEINDTYGHLTGDRILADVGATFKGNTRYGDVIARYGGDEFVLLLPDTGLDEAHRLADRLLTKVRQLRWTENGAAISIGVSYGATESHTGATLPELLVECDRRLYGKKAARSSFSGAVEVPRA